MKAVTPRPGVLLLDDDAARYVRGNGYEPRPVKQKWSRWPWATQQVEVKKQAAKYLADLIRQYTSFAHGT